MRCCLKVFSLEWKLSSPYLKYIFVLIRKGRILGIVNTTVSITWQDFEGGKLRNSVSTGWETPFWYLQIALTAKSLTLKFNERSEAFSIQFPRSLTSQIGECELVHSFKSTNLYGSLWFVVVRTYHPCKIQSLQMTPWQKEKIIAVARDGVPSWFNTSK